MQRLCRPSRQNPHQRKRNEVPGEVAAIGRHVAPADPGRLDAQEPVFSADLRERELLDPDAPRSHQHRGRSPDAHQRAFGQRASRRAAKRPSLIGSLPYQRKPSPVKRVNQMQRAILRDAAIAQHSSGQRPLGIDDILALAPDEGAVHDHGFDSRRVRH